MKFRVHCCFVLVLLILVSFSGCKKKYVGETVSPKVGFGFLEPVTESRVRYKNMVIEYKVNNLDEQGMYRFEGNAELAGRAESGSRIQSIEFRILLIKDNVIIDNIRTNATGFNPGEPMKLFKEFKAEGGFDRIAFDWVIWYFN